MFSTRHPPRFFAPLTLTSLYSFQQLYGDNNIGNNNSNKIKGTVFPECFTEAACRDGVETLQYCT